MLAKALFLDRDGTIHTDVHFAHRPEQIHFIPGIFDLVRAARAGGEKIIIVTNQSGIGRGLYSEADFHALMRWMLARFEEEGAAMDAYYFCPHLPEANCDCRKPRPGMILQAAKEHNLDLSQCRLIGDKETDIQAARAAGIANYLLFNDNIHRLPG